MDVPLIDDITTRVLVVDDDPDMVKFLSVMLMLEGYQVLEAFRGTEGVEVARNETPDIILLDIMMSDLDGFEVYRKLKMDPGTSRIPVVFVTAKTARSDVELGLALGAEGYVTKPFRPNELLGKINQAVTAAA